MTDVAQHLITAFNVTGPLVLVSAVGMACRAAGLMDKGFVLAASKLIYTVSLPCLLFLLVLSADWSDSAAYVLIGYSLIATCVITALALLSAPYLVKNEDDRGVFVQGVYRSNMGIVALALVDSAYGAAGLALAAVPITLNTLLYNILAVFILNKNPQGARGLAARRQALIAVLRNPLILAITAGMLLSWTGLVLPQTVSHGAKLLSQLTLPLALLCVGASLQMSTLVSPDRVAISASIGKLIISPLLTVSAAYLLFDIQGAALGILFFMTASPAATAGFAMVVAYGGNAQLTAQMIALSTVASVATIGAGTFVLNYFGLM